MSRVNKQAYNFYGILGAPRIQDLPEVQQVQGGRQSLTYSCATQNHADKPWFAWWRFQLEGTDEVIDLDPDTPLNSGSFQVSVSGKNLPHT